MTEIVSRNPAHPSIEIVRAKPSTVDDVAGAVSRAAQAQKVWKDVPLRERGQALHQLADRLADQAQSLAFAICAEVGKTLEESRGEVQRSIDIIRYFAGQALSADGESLPGNSSNNWIISRRYPVGVIGLITPWNFPLAIPVWKAAPALVYGNAALLKPASASLAVAQLLVESGDGILPPGLFQLLRGEREVSEAIIDHPSVSAISFTGSTPVGRLVAARASARGIAAQCEMGGQNASIVLPDANLELAAATVASAIAGYAGQKCTATGRVIAHKDIADEFVERLSERLSAMTIGDPALAATDVGPLIDDEARTRVLSALQASEGRHLVGGQPLRNLDGFYLSPALVEIDKTSDVLFEEETFGPVASVIRASSAEHALALANHGQFGLAAAVFTQNLSHAMAFSDGLKVGMVKVNGPTSGADFHAPFGGSGASSLGPREQGQTAREFYTQTKTLSLTAWE